MGNTPPSIPSWMGISPDYMKTMMAFMLGDGTRRFVPGGGIVSARVMTIDTVNLSGVNWVTRGAATGGAAAIVH